MPGLGTSLGFGAASNHPRDLANSDCILVMGSNMAESHPVGFHWPVLAQQRGAVLMHIDPRYTRTSAVADVFVKIRAGTDIAFLGGIVRYILEGERYFKEYVVHYTNAATLVADECLCMNMRGNTQTTPVDVYFDSFDLVGEEHRR